MRICCFKTLKKKKVLKGKEMLVKVAAEKERQMYKPYE